MQRRRESPSSSNAPNLSQGYSQNDRLRNVRGRSNALRLQKKTVMHEGRAIASNSDHAFGRFAAARPMSAVLPKAGTVRSGGYVR